MKKLLAPIAIALLALTGVSRASAALPFTVSNPAPTIGQTAVFTADPCPVRCAFKWTVTSVDPVSHRTVTYMTDAHQSIVWTFSNDMVLTFTLRETAGNGTNSVLAQASTSIRATP